MSLTVILLAVCMTTVECVDREKLSATPTPQKNFNIDKWLGDWYHQARWVPCSWAGSDTFTNIVSQYRMEPSGTVNDNESWWNEVCSTITMSLKQQDRPGVFTKTDPIGGVISGDVVIVATDYKKFAVSWGCSKRDTDGSCSDTRVTIKTRKLNPSPHTWKVIEGILDHYWKLNLTEMVRVIHDENACVKLDSPTLEVGPPIGFGNLRKKY